MLRLLIAAVATGLLTSAGAAQVAYPARSETFDVHLRYRIRAERDDRIRQFRELQRHLKALGFVETQREDGDRVGGGAGGGAGHASTWRRTGGPSR